VVKVQHRDFPLRVSLLDRARDEKGDFVLPAGEEVRLAIEPERDAYIEVSALSSDGKVVRLFPNEHEEDNYVRGGKTRLVPGNNNFGLRVRMGETRAAREYILVVATTKKQVPEKGERWGGFALFEGPARDRWEKQQRTLRGIDVVPKRPVLAIPNAGDKQEMSEEVIPYRVVPPR
jgi:hypothetical protein